MLSPECITEGKIRNRSFCKLRITQKNNLCEKSFVRSIPIFPVNLATSTQKKIFVAEWVYSFHFDRGFFFVQKLPMIFRTNNFVCVILSFCDIVDFINNFDHNFQLFWDQKMEKMMFISKDAQCSIGVFVFASFFLCDS